MKTICPSCSCEHFFVLRKYPFSHLSKIWQEKVGFDPFLGRPGELCKLQCPECALMYYSPAIIGEADLYDRLSRFGWYYPKNKWEFDHGLELVRQYRPRSVLEVGCGAGEFLHRLQNCVSKVAGIDINPNAIELARAKGLQVSGRGIHEMEETFDMIFLFQVLEHLERPGEFVGKLAQRLNPGGHLVLAVPNPNGFMKDVEVVFLDMPPHHYTCWSAEALENLGKAQGLYKAHYAAEPLKMEYTRTQIFAQIEQDRTGKLVQLTQKVAALAFLPLLHQLAIVNTTGQTHLVVLKKPESGMV